jgi:hypothetical protein
VKNRSRIQRFEISCHCRACDGEHKISWLSP